MRMLRISRETLNFEITDDAVFKFVDYNLSLSDTDTSGNRYRITNLDDF